MNWEVVQRALPCAFYANPDLDTICRWCKLLNHVRIQGDGITLCGHHCSPMENWILKKDWHPEDVDAIDRCQICYQALLKRIRLDGQSYGGGLRTSS